MDKIDKKLKLSRTNNRRLFTKSYNDFEREKSQMTKEQRILTLKVIEEKAKEMINSEKLFREALFEEVTDETLIEHEVDESESYIDKWRVLQNDLICTLKSNSENGDTSVLTVNNSLKYPKLKLPTFDGEIQNWLGFWGQFKKIDTDNNLDDYDKFAYLAQSMEKGSVADDLIKSFPPGGDSYEKAVTQLQARFGRDELLIDFYVRELLTLVLQKRNSKISLRKLYDLLETKLRALDTLGVARDKFAAMLYPLVESSLPDETLRAWERNRATQRRKNVDKTTALGGLTADEYNEREVRTQTDLECLLSFLRDEVEGEERFSMAVRGFRSDEGEHCKSRNRNTKDKNAHVPTASNLFTSSQENKKKCIFCSGQHASWDCRKSRNMSLQERQDLVQKSNSCFLCLRVGHGVKSCKAKLSCPICGKKHNILLCRNFVAKQTSSDEKKEEESIPKQDEVLTSLSKTPHVILQTLSVILRGEEKAIEVRAIIDTASQRSYILESAANKIGYQPIKKETLIHSVFGGTRTNVNDHNVYRAYLSNLSCSYNCNFEVLGQKIICETMPPVAKGPWIKEIVDSKIKINDMKKPIEVLIGADVAGKLFTGGYKRFPSGLAALETKLGWTVMGRTEKENTESNSDVLITMFAKDFHVTNLWDLDTLGITDPAEKQTKEELAEAAEEHFIRTLKRDSDGRYEVSLPWLEGHPPIPNNRRMAERRLYSTVKSLKSKELLDAYEEVFKEWKKEDIIESIAIPELDEETCHYLPHRAVIREHATTKIRPVFDASAKERNKVSLNDCIEKGPNYVELIPRILNRFRTGKYGVTADIRKAFLQIGVKEDDRNMMRFLWWEGGDPKKLKIFRHKRLVFGVNSSPFLLGATLNYHLSQVADHHLEVAKKLSQSMYVDNCVASLDSEEELNDFITQSKEIMASAMFDLRGWTHNGPHFINMNTDVTQNEYTYKEESVSVLGLKWNVIEDTLYCDIKDIKNLFDFPVTKRSVLSLASKIFDPLGFFSPVTLVPKLIMQQCWRAKLSWDAELPEELVKNFLKWKKELIYLEELKVPRRMFTNHSESKKFSFHVFCDASQHAYATCIYLRCDNETNISCQLVQSRSRVAPLKPVTISRLELLACLIGSRLMRSIKEDLRDDSIPVFYWTDSMNALHWIKRKEQWATFVINRVNEIRFLSSPDQWNHVPGSMNPADLPSRGCLANTLVAKNWIEGPTWLKREQNLWPTCEVIPDVEIVNSEKRKTVISSLNTEGEDLSYFTKISSFEKLIRVTAWIMRFFNNCKTTFSDRMMGNLNLEEMNKAETIIWKTVQKNSFESVDEKILSSLQPFIDAKGVIRMRTRLLMRNDTEDFKYPIILPSNHPIVSSLIMYKHKELLHCGIQILMANLREKYWILQGRKTIRKVLKDCMRCKRFTAKKAEVQCAPLPEDRIRDSSVFEVTGVDLAGPLYLKDSTKSWIVLFTCAVYRSIHLELVSSLSTDKFLLALRRFIARRGRPTIIYSDNGSNFIGSNNALKRINWDLVVKDPSVKQITWKFIPPASPWWGGWWERLVGIVKDILRKVLGRASLKYEELNTILCDCENVVNSRPITYMSEDLELEPLTAAMFLHEIKESGVPDLDHLESVSLQKRYLYRLKLREDLRKRFRTEYLGQLRQNAKKLKKSQEFLKGDIVLVEDESKRLNWPLGKIVETYPGKDGLVRVVKVKTKFGEILRPIQRMYPLEMNSVVGKKIQDRLSPSMSTRYGRTIHAPDRLTM